MKLPKLTGKLAGGTLVNISKNHIKTFALIRQVKNPYQYQMGMPIVYVYHIVQLAINGRGWCNGRYDLPDSPKTFEKFNKLANA